MKRQNRQNIGWLGLLIGLFLLGATNLASAQVLPSKLVNPELARKAAQSYVDMSAKDFPDLYKGALVTGEPTLCHDLDGNPSAYVFTVTKEEVPVGFATTGVDPDGPTVYFLSSGISPMDKREIAYKSWGKTSENLRVDISKGRGKILFIRGLEFFMSPSDAESKARGTEYIRLKNYSRVSTEGLRKMQEARMAGLANAKKDGHYRTSWQKIAAYKPAEKPLELVPSKPNPAMMRPAIRQGNQLIPLPKNRVFLPPPVDVPPSVNLPVDTRTGAMITVMERGEQYLLTYDAQHARNFDLDVYYVSPFEGNPLYWVENIVENHPRDITGRYLWKVKSKFRPESRCVIGITDSNNPRFGWYNASQEFYITASKTLDDVEPFLEYRAEAATVEAMNLDYMSKHGFPDLHFKSYEFYWEPFPGMREFTDAPKGLVDIIYRNMNIDQFGFGRGGASLDEEVEGALGTVFELGYGAWKNQFDEIFPPVAPVTMLRDPQAHIFRAIIDEKRPGQWGWPGFPPQYNYSGSLPNGFSPALWGASTCVFGFAFHTNEADRDSRIFYIYMPRGDREIITVLYESQSGPANEVLFDYHEMVPPDMVVKFPSEAGIYVSRGQTIRIKWGSWATQTGTSNVRIELFRNGTKLQTIVSSTANDGSYDWTVPTSLASGAGYKIRITSTSDSSIFDISQRDFAVASGRDVYSPNTSGLWRKGQSMEIKWRGFVGANVRIHLYRNSTLVRTISNGTANDGSYLWTVPDSIPSGSGYSFVIAETTDSTRNARSRGTLSILPWPRVLTPNGNLTYMLGSAYDIKWKGFAGTNVTILLMQGSSVFTTITAATANDGQFRWYLPLTLPDFGGFRVKIISRGVGGVIDSDDSNDPFAFYIPFLPNGFGIPGSIDSSSDVDYYRFMLPVPTIASIETSAGALLDTVMELYGPTTPSIHVETDNDDGRRYLSRIDRPLLVPGEYYFVKVRAYTENLRGNYYVKLTTRTAPQVFLNNTYYGQIRTAGDVEWTTFSLDSVGITSIETIVDTLKAAKLTLYDSTGKQLVSLRAAQGDVRINRVLQPGMYYLKAESGVQEGIGRYRFRVSQETAIRKGEIGTPEPLIEPAERAKPSGR